ncbi:MAG TPA: hypothetical protein VNZ86_09530 [Bacteroidia bacterium]|nr:hypothetical protein [Bacteroidia bacterium]
MEDYLLVLLGSMMVDIVPIPLPPAFTVMIFLQIHYNLDITSVIACGVSGSILGRYILTLYIPKMAGRLFNPDKNADMQFLGGKLKQEVWKTQFSILAYSLMPLPTTPLFLASGMARVKPLYIIPAFTIGKIISDTLAVLIGKYATENTASLLNGLITWKSITGFGLGLLFLFTLLFIDWRKLIQERKLSIKFNIWSMNKI